MEMAVVISMRQRKKSLSIYWEPNQIVINGCITKYIVISVTLEKKNLESKSSQKTSCICCLFPLAIRLPTPAVVLFEYRL